MKVVKPHAEILDTERGRDYIPIPAVPAKEKSKDPQAKIVASSEASWARVEKTSARTWCTRFGIAFIGMITHKIYLCLCASCESCFHLTLSEGVTFANPVSLS